ncbi:hypothetical protein HDU78_005379 [Chytriomyces hyalinus]|nr:hypothetical protein HDU78_005379 [Chytriomyces hyalinus]
MQKRCRFYNGKLNSCRKGDTCEFSHIADDPSGPSDAGRGSSKNDHKTKFAQKDYGKSKDPCKAFFAKGRCRNGGECRFVHIANNLGSASASSNVRARAEEYAQLSARLVNSQLLSYRGSALLAAHEGDQRYTPCWKAVINHGHFGSLARSQGKATKFVQSLLQASFVDAESLLMELGATTPPQSQTSREVLTTLFNANYSHACSTSMKQSLSFQRCLVPLLVVLVSERVINSPVSVYVSAIFGIVRSSLETFLGKYLDCVDACLQQGTVDDLSCPLAEIFSSDPSICVPMYFVQVALPFIRCLQEVVSIFADVAYETAISSAVERIGKQLSSTAFKKTESQYALNVAIHEYERLFSIVNKARRELKLGEIVSDFDAMKISKKLKASAAGHPWSFMEQLIPAGSLPVAHSNDHFHISRIAIIPTMDEIKSSRQPALPGNFQSVQQAHWLAPGPDRLLDTHFRLLREDLVRPVRSNIMGFIGYILSNQAAKQKGIRVRNNRVAGVLNPNFENGRPMQLDVSYYENANIDGFEVVNQQGLCANVTFTRPQFMKGQTKKEQKDYWLRSGRLGYGMLVALIFKTSNVPSTDSFLIIFGIIATKNVDKLAAGPGEPCMVTIKIPLKFLTPDVLLTLQSSETNGYLIETNNIMFEEYRPILAALQKLNPAMLPFKELIAPASDPPRSPHSQQMIVPPSMYATVPNFFMDLSQLCKKPGSAVIRLHPESEISIKNAIRALNAHSTLDEGQSRALVSVLSRQVGCIQGPPGTGKSYVGVKIVQTLLQNKAKTTPRNPILVICFTNHALDQFITDLMDIGVKKIVRLRSTSNERVAPLLIKNLAAAVPQDTGISAFRVGHIMEEIKGFKEDLSHYNDSLGNRNKDLDWEVLSEHLQVCNYAQYDAFKDMRDLFIEEENEGFQVKGGRKNETIGASDVVKRWLAGADGSGTMNSAPSGEKWPRSDEELADDPDVWDMSIPERKALMAYWKRTVPRSSLDGILELQQRIEAAQAKLDGVYKDRDACSFRGFNIIGATTTGAAKNHSLIQAIAPKIVVLESHTLAALQPDVQQLILIGDHLQLRPRVALHELTSESADGKKYRLDVSMFERLQDPAMKFPMETLNVQRRMRPTIADFIRKLFYPQLKDAPHVQTYPDVAALAILSKEMMVLISEKDMKEIKEATDEEEMDEAGEVDDSEASGNVYGSKDGKLTVIAQSMCLNSAVRVSTIDNFQGEEAKIILISLVRSEMASGNESIGFLKTPNRTNVLLSRAKHGMYLMKLGVAFRKVCSLAKLIQHFEEKDAISGGLPIYCQKHPNETHNVSEAEAISDQQADVICMTSYGELELDEDPVVVLDCGHVFTIATLDGTLDMDTVYSTDEDGWRLAQLPPEFIALPVCPSCRSRIVGVNRYGRILNLAVCRTAEKMWISQTASNMNDFSVQVNTIAKEALVNAQNVKLPPKGKLAGFIPLKQLTRKLEEFQKGCAAAPQRRMFEASVTYLCKTGVKHKKALEMMALSLPKPHANFARMSVALVASAQLIHVQWLSRIVDRMAGLNDASSFVEQSVTVITKTVDMTTKALRKYKPINSRHKEMSEYELELLTFELRVEKFRVMGRRFEITGGQDFDRKIVLADLDSDWGVFKSTLTISFMSQHNSRVKALDEKLENLKISGRISVEEMKIVAHAMEREFGIAGHWYQCPNGHPYAIGECGMAMQQARCYECGVPVGGQSHRLTSDNRAFNPLDIN